MTHGFNNFDATLLSLKMESFPSAANYWKDVLTFSSKSFCDNLFCVDAHKTHISKAKPHTSSAKKIIPIFYVKPSIWMTFIVPVCHDFQFSKVKNSGSETVWLNFTSKTMQWWFDLRWVLRKQDNIFRNGQRMSFLKFWKFEMPRI